MLRWRFPESWGYPKIIHDSGIVHFKPSSYGVLCMVVLFHALVSGSYTHLGHVMMLKRHEAYGKDPI